MIVKYIVKSGPGYLVKFVEGSHLMTTDPIEATRFTASQAELAALALERLGCEARPVKVEGQADG